MAGKEPGIYQRTLKSGEVVYDAVAQVNGRQKWSRGHKTQKLAKAARDEMRVSMRRGQMGSAPARLTLADYLDKRWLPWKEGELDAAESVRNYKYAVARINAVIGQIRLAQLKPLDLEDLKTALRREGLSGTSANLIWSVLKQALKQAVRWGILTVNPADQVDAPKKAKFEAPYLDVDALKKLIEAADGTLYGALVYTAIMTGMRWGELVALRWADVDFGANLLMIPKSKTARGVRAVALGPATIERLQMHRQQQMRFFFEHGKKPPALVFLTETGAPLNQGNFNVRWWQSIRKAAGLPTLRFHDLRHAQATLLARAGVHPRIAQDRLGHASAQLTMDVYTHVSAGDQAPAAAAVEGLIFNA